MSKRNAIVDEKTLVKLLEEVSNPSDVLKVLNLISKELIEKIMVTDKTLKELENKIDENIYNNLIELLLKKEVFEYIDLKTESDTSDELVEYAINNDMLFVSLDKRLNLKYKLKSNNPSFGMNEEKIKIIFKILKDLEKLDNMELEEYLQAIFDKKIVSSIDYIQLSEEEKYKVILDFIVEMNTENESEELKFDVKEILLENKIGKIKQKELKKSLAKLKGYNFGELTIKESMFEKYSDLIERFLEENNFESFEALKKTQSIFDTDECIIEKIVEYYR